MSIASAGLSHDETPHQGRSLRQPLTRRTYTIEEVGQLLGLSRNRAFVAARENRLPVPVIRVGKRMFVSQAIFDRFLETGAGENAA
jgi:hypothetical protein